MLADHKKAVLEFSGGKDSTALLHLARPFLDRVDVIFCDTGASFPHVVDFVMETCRAWNARLTIVRPVVDVKSYTEEFGLPSDIVPVDSSPEMRGFIHQRQPLQSYFSCCRKMLWEPMHKFVIDSDATLVLRGAKKSDPRVGVPPGHFDGGIEYASPLWNWSDDKVHAYLKQEGVSLPAHYASVNDSLDCWLCSAHLAHHGKEKLAYLKEAYPAYWQETSERIARVRSEVMTHLSAVNSCYSAVD